MPIANHDLQTRRGYTLLEMLILVALIALVAGLSWPSLRRLSHKRELLEAARQVRVELLRTRLDAIQSGVARQFRYQLGSGQFESSVFSATDQLSADDAWSEDAELPPASAADMGLAGESAGDADDRAGLPVGVFFVGPDSGPDVALEDAPDDSGGAPDWSAPILFYPNGRTLNASLRLSNADYAVVITLRGLTGTAEIGRVQRLVDDTKETIQEVP